MHSVPITAASIMNLSLFNPFKHKEVVILTNKTNPNPEIKLLVVFLTKLQHLSSQGETSVLVYL